MVTKEEILRTCEKHGPYMASILHVGGATITSSCPSCLEVFESQAEIDRLAAEKSAQVEAMRAMNIEPEYYEATLESFRAETPELARSVEIVRKLINREILAILMTGSHGTGKTHLAISALKEIGEGRILTMYEISTMIRASYVPGAKKSELEIVSELASLPMLVIDELGRTKGSDVEANWLSYIIDKRHTRKLPLIIITNKHVRAKCPDGGCANCVENYISEDIMSRIIDGGKWIQFSGEDWRRRR